MFVSQNNTHMNNKIIGIVNQKGGVGKTTIAALLASYLAYHKKLPVVAGDFDFPQHSLMNIRERNKEILIAEEDKFQNRFLDSMDGVKEYKIFDQALESLPEIVNSFKRDFDGVNLILDLPGTLNIPSFASAIKQIDIAIIPFSPSMADFDATFMAIETIYKINPDILIIAIFNKVKKIVNSKQNASMAAALRNVFRTKNFKFLNHVIYDLELYKRDPITLLFDVETIRLFEELENVMNINIYQDGKIEY